MQHSLNRKLQQHSWIFREITLKKGKKNIKFNLVNEQFIQFKSI